MNAQEVRCNGNRCLPWLPRTTLRKTRAMLSPRDKYAYVLELVHPKCFLQGASHGGSLRLWNHENLWADVGAVSQPYREKF